MNLKVISNYFWSEQGDFKPSSCVPVALFPITYFAVFKTLSALCNQRVSLATKHLLSLGGSILTAWAASQVFCQRSASPPHTHIPKEKEKEVGHTSLKDRDYSLDGYEVGHKKAKEAFIEEMQKTMNLEATFVNADCTDWESSKDDTLDSDIFYWSITWGVQNDIPKASKDQEKVHLFSVASQYNAAEAATRFTPPAGQAMDHSKSDFTQGPLAQRTNPQVFEIVNALLANLGFNMLENVLPSAGKTYREDDSIAHGYLCPTNDTIEHLANEFETNYRQIELPCYESRPTDNGETVQLMLTAAPALGYSGGFNIQSQNSFKLQKYAFKANFYGLFKQTLTLLDKHPNKTIVLHITGTGLGVFRCSEKTFAEEFKEVALHFQSQLTPEQKSQVRVQLESYNSTSALKSVAETLELPRKERV